MRRSLIVLVALLAFGLVISCGGKKEQKEAAPEATEQVQEEVKIVDPVCGMEVDTSKVKISAEYEGHTYYFCSEEDKTKFEANPAEYVKEEEKAEKSEGGEMGEKHEGKQ